MYACMLDELTILDSGYMYTCSNSTAHAVHPTTDWHILKGYRHIETTADWHIVKGYWHIELQLHDWHIVNGYRHMTISYFCHGANGGGGRGEELTL